MKQARFTKHARAELLGQTAYYEALERGLGARFRAEVEAAAQRAAAFPLHGKPTAGGTRRRLVAELADYHLVAAARADLLRRSARHAEAALAYAEALQQVRNPAERAYLERRLREAQASA